MKKIILTIFVAASFLASCSDAYEVEQPGYVSDEASVFSTPSQVSRGVKALYNVIPAEEEVQFASFYTDELGIGLNNLGQGTNDGSYNFSIVSNNEYANDIWASYYNIINRANRIENRVKELLPTATPAEITAYNQSLAEIYALRAFSNLKLFSYFTPDYTNPSGLAIIKFDFLQTDNYTRFEKRATVSEIVAFIEDDIEEAKRLVGEAGMENFASGYASNAMLEAILIKLYSMVQTPAGYVELENAFNRLNESKNLGGANEFLSMFGEGDGTEGIFKYMRIVTDGAGVQSGVASAWYPTSVTTQVYMEIGRSLYNELDKLDPAQTGGVIDVNNARKDARFTASVLDNSLVASNYMSLSPEDYRKKDVLRIGKYQGLSATQRPLMNSIWVFRFSDMLLALAEKRAANGNLTGTVALGDYSNVESIIFNIRAHRNTDETFTPVDMPTNFSSPQQAYARILEERRLEFAFEGHRYLDMKRLGVKAGSSGFVRHEKDCLNVCSLEASSYKLTMPIPRPEMVANPNMVQNTGY